MVGDVIASFDYFGIEEQTFVNSCPSVTIFNGRLFYYCGKWQPLVGCKEPISPFFSFLMFHVMVRTPSTNALRHTLHLFFIVLF